MTPTKVFCATCGHIVTAKLVKQTGRFVPRKHKCIPLNQGFISMEKKIKITITMTEEQAVWLWQALDTLLGNWDEGSDIYKFFERIKNTIERHR